MDDFNRSLAYNAQTLENSVTGTGKMVRGGGPVLTGARVERYKRMLMREPAILAAIPRPKPTRWERLRGRIDAARNWLARKIGTPDIFVDDA